MRSTFRIAAAATVLMISQTAVASMVSYWNFDSKSGSTITDVMGNHNGALVGGADITTGGQGYAGEALSLQSAGQYMDVLSPTTYNFNNSFTWFAMIRTNDGSGAIFSRNPNGTAWNTGSKALFVRSNTVQADAGWVGNPQTGTSVVDNQWHQVIMTFNAADDATYIYVDGVMRYNATFNMNAFNETASNNGGTANSSFTVGMADFSGGLSSLDTLVGLIDNVAVFDTAVTGSQLTQLMSTGPKSFGPDAAAPEPATLPLMALSALGLLGLRRRK